MPCSTGDACSSEDMCINSVCTPGIATNCDDDDECTIDECDSTYGCKHRPICPDPAVFNWPTRTEDGNVTGYVTAFTTSLSVVVIWDAADGYNTTTISAYLGLVPPPNLPQGLSYSFTAPKDVTHIELVIPFCDIPGFGCGSTFYLATRIETSEESWIQSEDYFTAANGCCCFDYSSYYSNTASSTITITSASMKRFDEDPDDIASAVASLLQITPSSVYIISYDADDNGFYTVEIGFADSQTTPSNAATLLSTLSPSEFEKVGLVKVTVGETVKPVEIGVSAGSTFAEHDNNMKMAAGSNVAVPALLLLLLSLLGTALVFLLQ